MEIQNRSDLRFRTKRITPLIEMITVCFKKYGYVSIIDIGGTKEYWNILPQQLLRKNNVTITIANLPGKVLPEDNEYFKFVEADGCDLSDFKDDFFHIAHSNSVIEHVGDWDRMVQFANEVSRVAKNYFVQTPNYWFPIEPHFMVPIYHWLPKPLRISMIMRFNLGHREKQQTVDGAVRTVESARLLNKKMFSYLFGDVKIFVEKLFLFPKSFIAIKGGPF